MSTAAEPVRSRQPPWPRLVLWAGLLSTALVVLLLARGHRDAAQRELDQQAQLISGVIERRIGRWGEVLSGVRGLYGASDLVTADEFRQYFDHLDLRAQHPGFLSLQFIERVPGDQRAAFEAAVQADPLLMAGRGAPFRIHPPGERDEYLVSLHIEPRAGNEAAFGFDAAHDPARREAFHRARDSGALTASGRLALVQRDGVAGLALRLPLYRRGMPTQTLAQRRAAWIGVAAVVLDIDQFVGKLIAPSQHAQVALRLHDLGWADQPPAVPSDDNLLFDSDTAAASSERALGPGTARLQRSVDTTLGGRHWRFVFTPRGALAHGVDGALLSLVALLGTLASALAWRLLHAQAGAKAALEARVAERTAALAEANRQLRAGEERLALALAGGDLAIWDWEVTTDRLVWNERWWTLRGLPPGQEPPSLAVWQRHVHPDDLQRVMAALQRHLHGEAALYEVEYRVPLPSGGERSVLDRGRVVERDEAGRPLRMSGTNLDVTDRRQAEEARVQAETARRLAAAKDQFVARMSHELRTPLNAILGFSTLLQLDGGADDPRKRQHLSLIRQAGEHLLALLNDLLDLSAIEAGRLDMQPARQPVAERLEAALALLSAVADEAGVRLALHRPADESAATVAVWADATRLTQVLLNLLSNAIKYNQRGGRVDVGWAVDDGWVRLAVHDTGPGLTPEQLERLYQPFERLAAARSAVPGTGLGLVVTRRLLELMGGRIEVSSEPGVGSCFTVVLPVATD